ncbi:MAG TPA: N-acetylmuramoyl-L-alanine amidase [Clostridia bacterium]|nr:N-acetylmuramoyl-L-alanine amidase [Clostridia bacterium]
MARFKIGLDSGHSLQTNGKETPFIPELGRKIKEYEFNNAVKYKLMIAVNRCGMDYADLDPGDADIPLAQRSAKANVEKCDILISIHYNALDDKWDNNKGGLCVFHYPNSVEGRKLATCIHKYLRQGTKQLDRGVLSANFHMVRVPKMPAVLSENGFMDDRFEASLMLKESFQLEVAEEHCMGICEYLGVPYVKIDVSTPPVNSGGGSIPNPTPGTSMDKTEFMNEVKGVTEMLKVGSRGPEVENLQIDLTKLGYDTKGTDGIFGNNTKIAVIAFQADHKLSQDGIVGVNTQRFLESVMAAPRDSLAKEIDALKAKIIALNNTIGIYQNKLVAIKNIVEGK